MRPDQIRKAERDVEALALGMKGLTGELLAEIDTLNAEIERRRRENEALAEALEHPAEGSVRRTIGGRAEWIHPQGRGQAGVSSIGVSTYRELLERGGRSRVRLHLPGNETILLTTAQARRLVRSLEETIAQAERWG